LKGRILIFGLDGATFRVARPLALAGRMPTLARLLERGAWGEHTSTPEINSPNAWSTFITGKNAGKHGIYGFFETAPGSYDLRFVNGSFRAGKSLWRIATEHGRSVGIVNVPMTYPAEEVNGFIIAGPDAPSQDAPGFCSPPDLLREVVKAKGPYVIEAGASSLVRQGRPAEALRALEESIRARTEAACWLVRHHPTDLFMMTFTEADRVQHHFWKYVNPEHPASRTPEAQVFGQAIDRIYEQLDGAVAAILDAAGGDPTVIVVSDHGAGPSSARTFFINRWLESIGQLGFHRDESLPARLRRPAERMMSAAYLYARRRLSKPWKRRLRSRLPGVKNRMHTNLLASSRIDWPTTRAFSRENLPTIYVNVKGRYPAGTVEPGGEYQDLCQDLAGRLVELRCPFTGGQIVERVRMRDELYWGPHVDKAPDLLIEWKDGGYTERPEYVNPGAGFVAELRGRELARAEIVSRPSGIHAREGIFVASGEGIVAGRSLAGLELYDVTATLLHLLDVPVPRDLDGRVRTDLFPLEYAETRPVRYSEEGTSAEASPCAFSSEDADRIEERLRGLGYIE
jgi:predicted AlkP superfamily phosphohydrolase/phosphomutase